MMSLVMTLHYFPDESDEMFESAVDPLKIESIDAMPNGGCQINFVSGRYLLVPYEFEDLSKQWGQAKAESLKEIDLEDLSEAIKEAIDRTNEAKE